MKRDKEIYLNYVCPNCWFTLDRCTCDVFPPQHLIHIDNGIQEHIRILNNKGYYTMYCCEGHSAGSNTYISFGSTYFQDTTTTPKGFKYDKKNNSISYFYSTKLSIEEVEKTKEEKLSSLLQWCKDLPDII